MFSILLKDSLLRGVSKFANGCMGKALVKSVVNFINDFSVKRGV